MKLKEVIEFITEEDKKRAGSKNSNWKSSITSRSYKYDASKQDSGNTRSKKHPNAKSGEVGYRAYHMRIQKEKGPASAKKCRKCGDQAADWAIVGKGGSVPLCRSCHNKEHHRGRNFTKNKK